MSLIQLLLILILFGVLLYLFNAYVTKIDPTIKKLINAVVIIAMVILCLYAFGVIEALRGVRVPKV